eukprot:CAMPEP_0201711656 /NCGR_PEP_ID=MMETSP0578-20130828/59251_1 /ASSEMBLY_ACC=CAM_ASM_000663 /TAXON_ID=267565 /ORGANISM="Skeletonema grethea, Strain CCMP 1804" /LENGTH=416 /DNA_ID=CAMNT_0048200709 /DNA_START=90 /DNA_END=1340 /DNA_ORIENTATION=+
MSSLQSTPTKPTAPTFETTRFIHKFGYHLARKLLGQSTVNKFLKEADESLQNIDGRQKNQTHTFRANWRGPATKFPWMLQCNDSSSSWNVDGKMTPESLFIDITFDFLVFPYEVTEEGRTSFCHVVKSNEWKQDDFVDEERLLSLSVAIRLGALIAVPDNNKETISSGVVDDKNRYYYQRGNSLSGPDVYEHCRGVDIVPEVTDASQIADIIAKALLNDDGRIVIELSDENASADAALSTSILSQNLDDRNDAPKMKWYWKLELHHKELEGKGTLPLKSFDHTNVFSKAYDDQNFGTPIDHSVLDTFLMNNQGQCVSIPANVASLVWNQFDPTLLESLKEPAKPSPRKPAPALANPYATKPSSPKAEEENKSDGNRKPKIRKASPVKNTAVFAKGKRTTVAGQKKKKPKFTIGPKR